MSHATLYLGIFIGAIAFTQGCASAPVTEHSFGFVQTNTGKWEPKSINRLQDYLVASKVVCRSGYSVIEVTWNSESGDWAAFDNYDSRGPFFTRIIRFAQFPDTITIIKDYPSARATMKIGGDDIKQYDYLLNELRIWSKKEDIPFGLPRCAANIFKPK